MQQHTYKRRRKVNGKLKIDRCYTGRFKLSGDLKQTLIPLNVTDKQVADRMLAKIVEEEQKRRAGLPVSPDHSFNKELIEDNLLLFGDDLKSNGRGEKYIKDVTRFIRIVSQHQGWKTLNEIEPKGFLLWKSANSSKAPKTLNEYLNAFKTFLNWTVKIKAISSNPLSEVETAKTKGKETRLRRALTQDELMRLVNTAPEERALVYLAASYTGIRRSELAEITWSDVHLDCEFPHIKINASISKNSKDDTVPLHHDLVARLKAKKLTSTGSHVFEVPSRMHLYKKDLKAADIPYKDEKGRQADFHALRHTFATMLHANGANQAVAMKAMRHSDPKLTAVTYNDSDLLPVANAVSQLPSVISKPKKSSWTYVGTHIGTHVLGLERLLVSRDDSQDLRKNLDKDADSEAESRDLTQNDSSSHFSGNGSCGWIRTNDLVVNSHPLYR